MKSVFLRVPLLVLAISGLALAAEDKSPEAVPIFKGANALEPAVAAEAPVPAGTNAVPDQPTVKVVQTPAPPDDVKPSPALAEVIKLVQAGVGEEVTRAYVSNSTKPFNVSSDQIVYLNDLGVSGDLITALIQHDSSLGAAPNQSGVATPLPPSLVLTSPATNIYGNNPPPPAPEPATPGVDPNAYAPPPAAVAEGPATPGYFYDSLAPYGTWIDVQGYGRCWQPTVAVASPSWRPYCERGHWIWTDCGWYWYSDYSWGWAPFHYGRWCSYPRLGWFWVPDTRWGPAWVSWRYTSSHCGWAPLPPAAVFAGGGFHHGGFSVGVGVDFGLSAGLYTFVGFGHFTDRSFYNHRVSGGEATIIYNHSTVINNYTVNNSGTVVNHGVPVNTVAHASGRTIPTVTVQTAIPGTPGRAVRQERLEKNGTTLAVVRPSPATLATPPRFTTGSSSGNHTAINGRSATPAVPTARTADPTPRPSQAVNDRIPTFKGRPEQTVPIRNQEPVHKSASSWSAAAAQTPKSAPASPPVVSDGKPQPRSLMIPSVADHPAATQSPPPRTVTVPPVASTEPYRVYPAPGTPGVASRPASPRIDNPAAPFGRPAFTAPATPTPSRQSPGVTAPPNYRSEAPRTPSVHSEPSHAPATPSAAHSAPARSDSSNRSGGKKD